MQVAERDLQRLEVSVSWWCAIHGVMTPKGIDCPRCTMPAGAQMDADRIRLLTPRQREVLALVLDGACDKEIAAALGMAPGTIKIHTGHLFRHFGVTSRTRLMARLMTPRPGLDLNNG